MTLKELISALDLVVLNDGGNFDSNIVGGFTSDLLSDVMGNIEQDMVWITVQVHKNTVAVASLKDVAAVIYVIGAIPDKDTTDHAREEGVTLLSTDKPAFEISGLIYALLKQ